MKRPSKAQHYRNVLPKYLRSGRRFLCWRIVRKPNGKFGKIPFYPNGSPRQGIQGSEEDRAALGTFEEALEALERENFDGIGIALLPENEDVACDFDNCIDAQGSTAQWVLDLVAGTYYEISPSGRGIRAFFRGSMQGFKNHVQGIEIFHENGFVTLTGNVLDGSTKKVIPLPDTIREKIETFRTSNTTSIHEEGGDLDPPYYALDIGEPAQSHLNEAIEFLQSDDYEIWIAGLHALKPLGEKGKQLAKKWSMKSVKFGEATFNKTWRSIKRSRIGWKAFLKLAYKNGWPGPSSTRAITIAKGKIRIPRCGAPLMAQTFDPLRWTIQDILPEGCYLLAARPKIGKSWLALQIAIAITEAGFTLGKQAAGGAVLCLFLEDNLRRLQSRCVKHELGKFGNVDLFFYDTDWPRVGEGGEEAIEAWLKAHPDARLVVIDTLEKIRPQRIRNGSVYADDYAATQALKALSDKYKVTILIVAHNKKGKSESGDPIELISGSLGLSGGCDGALVIERPRGQTDAKFYVIGRDIEHEPDDGYVIRFNKATCKWEMVGDAAALNTSKAQQSVIDAIVHAAHPLTAQQVGTATKRGRQAALHILNRLVDGGRLVRIDGKPVQFDLPSNGQSDAGDTDA